MSAYKYANENKEELTFEFAHMGVNMPDETACLKLCSDFENLVHNYTPPSLINYLIR